MGWLFGAKKKVPKVPFPEGRALDEGALRLPGKISSERVIEPDQIKAAAGLGKQIAFPDGEENEMPMEELPPLRSSAAPLQMPTMEQAKRGPLYIKVNAYQEILGEIDAVKAKLNEMGEISKALEASEYNEEANFTKLRRAVKGLHDRLLIVDKTVFKTQG